ncbi:MAG: ATP-binding protein [Candidatus Velamenicoccus archaeovorus]
MNIKWRLLILFIQLAILSIATYIITGKPYVSETWFLAGLLAIVINPQLLEPYYPRPGDVIANALIFVFTYLITPKNYAKIGWNFTVCLFSLAAILSIIALLLNSHPKLAHIAKASRSLSQKANAQAIYSALFILSLVESFPDLNNAFWSLCIVWVIIISIGNFNWQALFSTISGDTSYCKVESMIGPSTLLLSTVDLPDVGSWTKVETKSVKTKGVVIKRIKRLADIWGQIHITEPKKCESILTGETISIQPLLGETKSLVGSVDVGSSEKSLRFVSIRTLEIGDVVGVPLGISDKYITYQLSSAKIERAEVKGGAHLVVYATANQLGIFDYATCRFNHHRWVPSPGGPIFDKDVLNVSSDFKYPEKNLVLGNVIGTNMPILLDCAAVTGGHLAILGMTKMGKSTLAIRLAKMLGECRKVIILDQTGEYISKQGFASYVEKTNWAEPGIMVLEPSPGEIPADKALKFFEHLVKISMEEYKKGTPIPRTIIIDEAHQFIPEPAGLGFNAPGRDSSFKIGLLMMQIRKYGISIILISQRTAVVAKSALSQCENLIAFRSVDQTGLDYLEALAGNDVRSLLPQLRQGEALVFGPAISSDSAVAIKTINPNEKPVGD